MLESWQEILDFYFDSIFNSFGLRIKDVLEYSKFKNRRPLGLPNILLDLRKKNIYITDNDIYSEEYYQNFFPEICEKNNSFFSYLKNGFNGVINYAYNFAKGIDNDEIKRSFFKGLLNWIEEYLSPISISLNAILFPKIFLSPSLILNS